MKVLHDTNDLPVLTPKFYSVPNRIFQSHLLYRRLIENYLRHIIGEFARIISSLQNLHTQHREKVIADLQVAETSLQILIAGFPINTAEYTVTSSYIMKEIS